MSPRFRKNPFSPWTIRGGMNPDVTRGCGASSQTGGQPSLPSHTSEAWQAGLVLIWSVQARCVLAWQACDVKARSCWHGVVWFGFELIDRAGKERLGPEVFGWTRCSVVRPDAAGPDWLIGV